MSVDGILGVNGFDILVFFVLFGGFIAGWIQGALRRLIGLAAIVLSFIVAANARGILSGWLEAYWIGTPRAWVEMVAFGALFVAFALLSAFFIQMLYRHTPIVKRFIWVDELAGGVIGVAEAAVLVSLVVLVLDTYFRLGAAAPAFELSALRNFWSVANASHFADFVRSDLLVAVASTVGGLLPPEIRDLAGGGA